jgi:hypothetical protein
MCPDTTWGYKYLFINEMMVVTGLDWMPFFCCSTIDDLYRNIILWNPTIDWDLIENVQLESSFDISTLLLYVRNYFDTRQKRKHLVLCARQWPNIIIYPNWRIRQSVCVVCECWTLIGFGSSAHITLAIKSNANSYWPQNYLYIYI